jgi:Flp pilus assembly pilin Flp
VVEYVVLLALIFIIVVAVVHGVGKHTTTSVAQASDGLTEPTIAVRTAAKAKPAKTANAGTTSSPAQPAADKE